jgi:2-polyprenyl-3-methyl-5-hydroxy-6-metoxy-1,4-benzoquinol methylase
VSGPAAAQVRQCPACGQPGATESGSENGWKLGRCARCGVRFTVDVPTDEQLAELYDRLYSEGDVYQMHRDEIRRAAAGSREGAGVYRTLIFLRRYRPQPGDRLLEVGCGVGTFLVRAKERGWDVEGVDLSEEAISASRDVHGLPVRVGSFDELEFEEGAYAAIAAWEVLEHLPDPRRFLERARRLLRPGGIIACSVPNEGAKVPYPEVRGPASVPPVHLNFWDRRSLKTFFELGGFSIDRVIVQRTMNSFVSPHNDPLRFVRVQVGAAIGVYEGIQLFAAVRAPG